MNWAFPFGLTVLASITYSETLDQELKKGLPLAVRTRYAALLTCTALLATPATDVAGPDDGKHVATQTHIDSPKAFWEDNALNLKSHSVQSNHDLADTATWVGKGWNQNGTNQYQFTVPQDPALAFVGKSGET